jgi:hypothetical protein
MVYWPWPKFTCHIAFMQGLQIHLGLQYMNELWITCPHRDENMWCFKIVICSQSCDVNLFFVGSCLKAINT